jgi:RecB family endonuclease NucS
VPEPAPEPASAEPAADTELTEAEKYAVIYPDRAARIRADRGLPPRLDFGPPEPEIVEALVNGTSRILRELDQRQEEVVSG